MRKVYRILGGDLVSFWNFFFVFFALDVFSILKGGSEVYEGRDKSKIFSKLHIFHFDCALQSDF